MKMSSLISNLNKLSIQNTAHSQKTFLNNFYNFLKRFEGKSIIMSIPNNDGIVYYKGKYSLLKSDLCKENIIKHINYFFEDYSILSPQSFIINIEGMEICDLEQTIDNIRCSFSKEQLKSFEEDFKKKHPKFARQNIIINRSLYDIKIYYQDQRYEFEKN
jgi:hypothetical protein